MFALNAASSDHALRTLFFELITRYGLNSRFKVFDFLDFIAHHTECTLCVICCHRNTRMSDKNLDFNVIITTLDFTSVGSVCCNVQM